MDLNGFLHRSWIVNNTYIVIEYNESAYYRHIFKDYLYRMMIIIIIYRMREKKVNKQKRKSKNLINDMMMLVVDYQ